MPYVAKQNAVEYHDNISTPVHVTTLVTETQAVVFAGALNDAARWRSLCAMVHATKRVEFACSDGSVSVCKWIGDAATMTVHDSVNAAFDQMASP